MTKLLCKFSLICISLLFPLLICSGCDVSETIDEPVVATETTPEEQSKALQAATSFLQKLDENNFDTWDDVSTIIKSGTSRSEWTSLTKTIRTTSGKFIKRDLSGWTCTENLPGAAKGRYFVFDHKSTFEKMELIERVVASLENNKWTIAGYHTTKEIPQSI